MLARIRTQLVNAGNATIAKGQKKYLKGIVKFHGVQAKGVSDVFNSLYKTEIQELPFSSKMELASSLVASSYFEEKTFGLKILGKNHKELTVEHIPILESYYTDGHIKEWATTDGFCGALFFELIKRNKEFTKIIQSWKDSSNLWLQRTSCVAFVKHARHGKHNEEIFDICTTTVQSQERFVQLGNGWVLRELYLTEPDQVVAFIKKHYKSFSREGLRYAIEKMPSDLKKELIAYGKEPTKKRERDEDEEKPRKRAKK